CVPEQTRVERELSSWCREREAKNRKHTLARKREIQERVRRGRKPSEETRDGFGVALPAETIEQPGDVRRGNPDVELGGGGSAPGHDREVDGPASVRQLFEAAPEQSARGPRFLRTILEREDFGRG